MLLLLFFLLFQPSEIMQQNLNLPNLEENSLILVFFLVVLKLNSN